MPYTSKLLIVGLLCIISTAVDFNLAAAQTETPPPTSTPGNPTSTSIFIPTSTPWSIFQWPTQSAFNDLCTPTPQATPTNPFPIDFTDYCLVQCEYCEGEGHEHSVCMDNCMEGISALTPTPTYSPPTPFPTETTTRYIVIDSIYQSHSYDPYVQETFTSGSCSPIDGTNRVWQCVANYTWESFHTSYRLDPAQSLSSHGLMTIVGRILPYAGSECTKKIYVTGNYGNIADYITIGGDLVTCLAPENVTKTVYGSPILTTYKNIGRNTSANRAQFVINLFTKPENQLIHYGFLDFYIGMDQMQLPEDATPTPSPTPTLNPYCSAGIPTPGSGTSYEEPIAWINPIVVTPGECYTIIPSVTLSIPEYVGLPGSVGVPGFGICLNYLEIEASLFGMSFSWMITLSAFLMAAGLVYREIAS